MSTEGRVVARLAVRVRMAEEGWDATDVAARGGLDVGTVRDFLNGDRWPRSSSQGKIEKGLDWPAGSIAIIEAGGDPPTVSADGQTPAHEDDDLLYQRPEGLSDDEWEHIRRQGRAYLDGLIDGASRER